MLVGHPIQPSMGANLSTKEDITQEGLSKQFASFVSCLFIHTEPTMKQLHQHVIPNIAAHWRKVAEFLEFKISVIDLIEEKCKSDPTRCCEETFRKWLKTADCGVGPKNWSTLIAALKGIRRLKSVAEELYQQLSQTLGWHIM